MNRRDYRLYLDGREAAAHGSGLSDSPHGGHDGDLWRSGVRTWLDEHGDGGGGLQDATGAAIPARPISRHQAKPSQSMTVGK